MRNDQLRVELQNVRNQPGPSGLDWGRTESRLAPPPPGPPGRPGNFGHYLGPHRGGPPGPPGSPHIPHHGSPQLPTPSHKTPKLTVPSFFTGAAKDVDCFLTDCGIYIRIKASDFPSEISKIMFILSYIRGGLADEWVITIYENCENDHPDAPINYRELFDMIKEQFGDPDIQVTAQCHINNLCQGIKTMEEYTKGFRVLMNKTGFGEVALIAIFKNGMDHNILQLIYTKDVLPDDLRAWMLITTRLDRHRCEFNQGQRWSPSTPRTYNVQNQRPQQQQQQWPAQPVLSPGEP